MTLEKNSSLPLLSRTQLLPTFPYLRDTLLITGERTLAYWHQQPQFSFLPTQLLDIHETGKECSVTSVKASRNMAKVGSKGRDGEDYYK
jgi:hypothetical protein